MKRTQENGETNPYLKNLNRIEYMVTLACSGRCKHCSEGDHRKSGGSLDGAIAARLIRTVTEKYPIESVMTFGGEPLLYPETVYQIHTAAKERNIPARQLITNGYFSRDVRQIHRVAEKLAECGVNEILLSVDAFHQETIPLAYVKEFAQAVRDKGIPLQTHPAWLVSPEAQNPYNDSTREILKEFSDMGISFSEGNVIFPAGNALKYLKDYLEPARESRSPYWQDPRDIHSICVNADGDVLNGNIYRQDIEEIFTAYRPKG